VTDTKPKWRDELYLEIYQLARSGLSDSAVAKTLGVTDKTFLAWRRRRPAVAHALRQARSDKKKGSETFREYVYKRLPEELQHVWDKIHKADEAGNPIVRFEALIARHGKNGRQHLFLHALLHSNFNASEACRLVNIPRATLNNWLKYDPDFAALVDEVQWHKANFFEGKLIELVERGEPSIVWNVNKTFNRKRGYEDKIKVEGKHLHEHVHAHGVVDVDSLGLPLDVRKQLLAAVRAKQVDVIDAPQELKRLAQGD
jgi:hypothetical protein